MKVQNATNLNGNAVKNQFIIYGDDFTAFQSYNRIIVKKQGGKVYLDKVYWDYSKTTGKYRNRFLGETKNETVKKIASGEYKLVDLNA